MRVSFVIGAQYGDEGKGALVNHLTNEKEPTMVVRFSGGAQAGHTVVKDGKRHVFSHFGAGTLSGAETYWSKFCFVEPGALVSEYEQLKSLGVSPKIWIDKECPVVTPFDIMANRSNADNLRHGTCGMGVGMAAKRVEEIPHQLTFGDILESRWILERRIQTIKYYYKDLYKSDFAVLLDELIDKFYVYCDFIKKNHGNFIRIKQSLKDFQTFDHFIFEGSQGILLDREIGFFPHVTRAHTSIRNAWNVYYDDIKKDQSNSEIKVYYVTRSYLTRHGNGPMSEVVGNVNLINNENETNINNKYQGEFRIAPLNLDLLHYAISKNEPLNDFWFNMEPDNESILVMTCMDQHPDLENIPVVVDGNLVTMSYSSLDQKLEDIFEIPRIYSHSEEFFSPGSVSDKLNPDNYFNQNGCAGPPMYAHVPGQYSPIGPIVDTIKTLIIKPNI